MLRGQIRRMKSDLLHVTVRWWMLLRYKNLSYVRPTALLSVNQEVRRLAVGTRILQYGLGPSWSAGGL